MRTSSTIRSIPAFVLTALVSTASMPGSGSPPTAVDGPDSDGRRLTDGRSGGLAVDGTSRSVSKPHTLGEVLVPDIGLEAVLRVDRTTGDRTIILSSGMGGVSFEPSAIAIDHDGAILIEDDSRKTIFRADPGTGDVEVVSSSTVGAGPSFLDMNGIAVEMNGDILVPDFQLDALFRVDPSSGDRMLISSSDIGGGPAFVNPYAIALEADGSILIGDISLRAILRVDAITGNRTIVASSTVGNGGDFEPAAIAVEADGGILIVDDTLKTVFRVDPLTGDRTVISSPSIGVGPDFLDMEGIAVDEQGRIFVSDFQLNAMFGVDPVAGDRWILSSDTIGGGPSFINPYGVVIGRFSDCNLNGLADTQDIAAGTSEDCNSNDVPDECEADCNQNSIADECDIAAATSGDCDLNGIPDECDIADCTLQEVFCRDCNINAIPDSCDLTFGTSLDFDSNGIPDECECRCSDLVFVIDDTGSMNSAIEAVKAEVIVILNTAVAHSGDDLRVGLITFKDAVHVVHPLTYDTDTVRASIEAIVAQAGDDLPEASDEALRELVSETVCDSSGDFDIPFRPECIKQAILITDALPGGCDDTFIPGMDDVNAMLRADEAAAIGVEVSAVFVPTRGLDPLIVAIMQYYAAATGGMYAEVESDGQGIVEAVVELIRDCPCRPEGDFDGDGHVDGGDYPMFVNCLGGPGGAVAVECLCEDMDADHDVDLKDFAAYQAAMAMMPSARQRIPSERDSLPDDFELPTRIQSLQGAWIQPLVQEQQAE